MADIRPAAEADAPVKSAARYAISSTITTPQMMSSVLPIA